jgi:hypothetical protein
MVLVPAYSLLKQENEGQSDFCTPKTHEATKQHGTSQVTLNSLGNCQLKSFGRVLPVAQVLHGNCLAIRSARKRLRRGVLGLLIASLPNHQALVVLAHTLCMPKADCRTLSARLAVISCQRLQLHLGESKRKCMHACDEGQSLLV